MDILIAGVGGQGTLLASEVHGMSQRGGSVITFVRIGENIYSPVIDVGRADIVIAFEKLEALRYAHYLKKDGFMLYSTQEIMPMPVVTGACAYPNDIEQRLPAKKMSVDALALAEQAGNSKAANSVMLGAFTKIMGLDKDKMKDALLSSIPAKLTEINVKAFELGYNA